MILHGKFIWLIGASEGIGAALARSLADAGAHVALSARSEDKLKLLMSSLPAGDHLAIPVDVTDTTNVEHAWNTLVSRWPQVDRVIYNAGTYEVMDAKHFDLAAADHMLDVNFRGATRVLSFVLPYFIARNAGHIALVGSVAGYRGLPSAIGYGASKAALIHLAENIKADLGNTRIAVQIINPGFVKTRLTAKNDFHMPCIITPEKAASYIITGLTSNHFEIHFPKRFSFLLKFLALLPGQLYFYLLRHLKF